MKSSTLEKRSGKYNCTVPNPRVTLPHACMDWFLNGQFIAGMQTHTEVQVTLSAFSSWTFPQLWSSFTKPVQDRATGLQQDFSTQTCPALQLISLGNRCKEAQKTMETISHYRLSWGIMLIIMEVFPVLHWIQILIHPEKNVSSLVTNWILFVKPIFVSKSVTVWEQGCCRGRRFKWLSTADRDSRNIVHR